MTVRAQLHDGTVLEFPDNTPDAVVSATVKNVLSGSAGAQPPKATGDTLSAGLRGQIMQGVTLGMGDEFNAASRSFPGWVANLVMGNTPLSDVSKAFGLEDGQSELNKAYTDRLAAERADLSAYKDAHPVAALGGEALGSMVAAPAGALNALRAGTEVALPMAKSGARMAGDLLKNGATMGAISGAGNAEGGASDRLAGALTGAAVGGTLGVAVPAAISGGGRVLGWAGSALGLRNADKAAENKVLQALARDGVTPDQLPGRFAATDKPLGLLDVGGENTLGLARAAAGTPGTARQVAADMLEGRQAGQVSRLGEDIRTNVAPQGYHDEAAALIAQRNADAAALYPEAMSTKPVWSERVQQFLDDPITKHGLRQGLEIQRLEALARGEKFNPLDYAITGFNEAGDPILAGVPNMRTLNTVKKGLDNILEGYRDSTTGRLALDERGRAVDEVRRAFLGEVDSLNPDYAAARQAWAGPTRARDVMQRGRDFANMDAPDIAREVARMSDADREFYQIGVAQALRDRLYRDTAQPGQNAALRISGEGLNEKLAAALGKDKADALLGRVKTEADMTGRRNFVRGGSQTANKQADAADMSVDTSVLANLLRGDLKGAAISTAGAAVRRASGLTPSTANSLAGLLYETDPTMNAFILSRLQHRLNSNMAAERPVAAGANAFARAAGVAVPGLLN